MSTYDFDLFTIGAGSGGVAASRRAASYGARVAIGEEGRVGGTCVLRGCVPKKLLVYGSHFHDEFVDAAGFGWTVPEPRLDWGVLVQRKDRELDRLNQVYERLLRDAGVQIIHGRARVAGPNRITVGERSYSARHILIATGGVPVRPRVPGIEHSITSNEALDLPSLPRRVVIVGGGYIGVEFAGIFNAAGARVVLLLRGDTVLRGFDQDIRSHLGQEMVKRGIELRGETNVLSVGREEDGSLTVMTEHGEMLSCDQVLYATGRIPNTASLGLEEAGVALRPDGAVVVDAGSRSSVPSIYAVGDCTNRKNLTPVAIAEGRALAETLFNNRPMSCDHRDIPTAVFSQPPVATVGLTEDEARAQHGAIDVYITSFRPMKHTLSGRDERTMMKLVVDGPSGRVLGCHMVGADAPEIIQGVAIAIQCGATKAHFDATVGIHPTAAEELCTMRETRPPR